MEPYRCSSGYVWYCTDLDVSELGSSSAGENRAPTPIMAYDGGVYMLLPC
jgi:hypothetical protein